MRKNEQKSKLNLKRETLRELDKEALAEANGGATTVTITVTITVLTK